MSLNPISREFPIRLITTTPANPNTQPAIFLPRHPFVSKHQTGQQDCNKIPKPGDDSTFYSGSMCNTYVKEEILSHCLCQTYRNSIFQDVLSGSITFFSLIDAKIKTRIPANVKRIPANTIWLAVSAESTCIR